MHEIYAALQRFPLFQGIGPDDLARFCSCLCARMALYKKGETVLRAAEDARFVGLVLSGSVRITKEDKRGHVSMLTHVAENEMFGEVLACAGIVESPVTITAAAETKVLLLNSKKLVSSCQRGCPFHKKLLENMLGHIANKTFLLNRKIEILSQRTTRDKLLALLDLHSKGKKRFSLPYNREEMARYLCVDRSAMSHELCKMRDEGLIKFNKHQFEVFYGR